MIPLTRPDDIFIAVIGVTGTGKTTFISHVAKDPSQLVIGHDLQSCRATRAIFPWPSFLDHSGRGGC